MFYEALLHLLLSVVVYAEVIPTNKNSSKNATHVQITLRIEKQTTVNSILASKRQ